MVSPRAGRMVAQLARPLYRARDAACVRRKGSPRCVSSLLSVTHMDYRGRSGLRGNSGVPRYTGITEGPGSTAVTGRPLPLALHWRASVAAVTFGTGLGRSQVHRGLRGTRSRGRSRGRSQGRNCGLRGTRSRGRNCGRRRRVVGGGPLRHPAGSRNAGGAADDGQLAAQRDARPVPLAHWVGQDDGAA
jgi:hypothetical protein